jgi:hypothetical protein
MTAQQCAVGLRLLHETGRVVHIAGGEAMLYWDILAEAVRLANEEGNAPHFIETNCSFAHDDDTVRHRLTLLAERGVRGLLASADPFHQEFVPAENFLRVRRIARDIFGAKNFWGPEQNDADIRALEGIARDEARLRQYVRAHPPSMVGTAQRKLSPHLDRHALSDSRLPRWGWRGASDAGHCRAEFQADTMWELHIDPYGNIQTNCGMILGRVDATTPNAVLTQGPENSNRFVRIVCEHGPRGLAELAQREHGFAPPQTVTQTCELCYLTRTFLHAHYPEVFGPREIYQ